MKFKIKTDKIPYLKDRLCYFEIGMNKKLTNSADY